MKHLAYAAFLLLAGWGILAQSPAGAGPGRKVTVWGPPKADWPMESMPKPTVPKEIITKLTVAGWPIELEETKLESTRNHFGLVIGARGDASEALSWICFQGSDEGGLWALWLYSSEIDGAEIGGFQWQRISPNFRVDRRCKFLDAQRGVVELPVRLQLGMTESEVIAKLGLPSGRHHHSVVYFHEHNLTLHDLPYAADNDVLITYDNGRVAMIAVNYTVSS
jgi:hypothetical protein